MCRPLRRVPGRCSKCRCIWKQSECWRAAPIAIAGPSRHRRQSTATPTAAGNPGIQPFGASGIIRGLRGYPRRIARGAASAARRWACRAKVANPRISRAAHKMPSRAASSDRLNTPQSGSESPAASAERDLQRRGREPMSQFAKRNRSKVTNEPESAAASQPPDAVAVSPEERLRRRVSMLTQLLVVAVVVVALQFGIMIKVLMENAR